VSLPPITLSGRRPRAEELYIVLRDAILSGDIPPGERLVERTIAAHASVSRTPAREALARLRLDGLVEETSTGHAVSEFDLDHLADLCAVRETLEAMATGLAAQLRSNLDVEAMAALLSVNEETVARGDIGATVEANHAFHEAIWRASRNRYLIRQLQAAGRLVRRLQDSPLRQRSRQRTALEEHRAIFAAVRDGDAPTAERLAREHFAAAARERLALGRGYGSTESTDDGSTPASASSSAAR